MARNGQAAAARLLPDVDPGRVAGRSTAADRRPPTADRRPPTADRRPPTWAPGS